MHLDRVRWIRSIRKYIYTAHCIITSKEKHSQSCEVTKTDFVHTNFTFPNCLGSSRPGALGLRRGRGGVGCGSVGVARSPEAAANGKPQRILQVQAGLGGGEGVHRRLRSGSSPTASQPTPPGPPPSLAFTCLLPVMLRTWFLFCEAAAEETGAFSMANVTPKEGSQTENSGHTNLKVAGQDGLGCSVRWRGTPATG